VPVPPQKKRIPLRFVKVTLLCRRKKKEIFIRYPLDFS